MSELTAVRQTTYTVALAGNPNSGKTTLFNALTGLRQKTGNYPGVTVEQVVENTGFELLIPENVARLEPPTSEELRLLREEIDPDRLYI